MTKKELHVLLIEDMTLDAELMEHEMHRGGLPCRTKRVETREQFLQELDQHPPDLILSDHGIPAFDGFTALALARERAPNVPFIFVTGAHGDEIAVETLKRGADDYVLKSHLHHLVPAVRRALRQTEERARKRQTELALHQSQEQLRLLAEDAQAHVERLVRQRTAQIEADRRELQEFTYTLALDLRAPLRHIDNFVEVLRKTAGDQLAPKARGCLKTIAEAARQMGQLTDELLTYCRIGQMQTYKLPIALGEVIKEVRQDLRRATEGRHVEWVVGELPEVIGDPTLLTQALTSLLDNALKFTRPRKQARIEIGSRITERETILFVRDNGVGFDPHYRDRLFGVFQRLHPAREFEGLGIGLANVRRIVQRHGGRAWAEGTLGQGATFYLALPRAQSPRETPDES